MGRKQTQFLAGSLVLIAALAISAVAAAGQSARSAAGAAPPSIKTFCGTKPITVAHIDGFGALSWRKITHAELLDEVSACPNVKVLYAEAGGDLQKFISIINAYVAQGVDAMVIFDDFGSAALGAIRDAHKAGVVVSLFIANPGGTPGVDYTSYVGPDHNAAGARYAKWLNKVLKGKGNVIFMGGIPGNPSSVAFLDGYKKQARKYRGLKLLSPKPIDTNWDPAQYQKATAALLTKYPKIDGIMSDYGASMKGTIRAYVNARRPLPPMAVLASSNEFGCLWQKYRPKNSKFQVLSLDGTTTVVRIALRKALAAVNGVPNNEPQFDLRVFMDTTAGLPPPCTRSLPPDADLSSSLSRAQLKALFK